MMRRMLLVIAFGWLITLAQPATAAVVITFWSHDRDQNYQHTFFALKGRPDAGGAEIDANFGFTARSISPAILFGTVAGMVEAQPSEYMRRSLAQFSIALSDAQYAEIRLLVAEWTSNSRYNLKKRNCVHFVAEAARRSGLAVPDISSLVKQPKVFLQTVAQANPGRITQIGLDGNAYFAAFGPPSTTPAAIAPR